MTSAPPRTPLQAMAQRRFLVTSWPWRGIATAIAIVVVGGTSLAVLWPLVVPLVILGEILIEAAQGLTEPEPGIVVLLLLLGLGLLLALGPLVAVPVAVVERWRLQLVHPPIDHGHRTPRRGLWSWIRTRYTEAATWREFAYLLLLVCVLLPLVYLAGLVLFLAWWGIERMGNALVQVPLGVASVLGVCYVVALVAHVNAVLGRVLLSGRDADALRAELVEVTRSRNRLVDAFEAERRRIERDLHDGAQQRLVALAMQLGLARMDLPSHVPGAQTVARAHEQAKRLIEELREFVHGIHPQVLTDRGLPAALPDLVDRCAIDTDVSVDLPHRLPTHVEGAAYFVVSEALANVTKHSEATRAMVTARLESALLVVEVVDDGRGGAEASNGSGLTGLADRVAVMDGRMLLSSPLGGPTRVRVELPCDSPPSPVG